MVVMWLLMKSWHTHTITDKGAVATSAGRGREEWESLRKAVQSILNLKYVKFHFVIHMYM